jgi:hypothetical protein
MWMCAEGKFALTGTSTTGQKGAFEGCIASHSVATAHSAHPIMGFLEQLMPECYNLAVYGGSTPGTTSGTAPPASSPAALGVTTDHELIA